MAAPAAARGARGNSPDRQAGAHAGQPALIGPPSTAGPAGAVAPSGDAPFVPDAAGGVGSGLRAGGRGVETGACGGRLVGVAYLSPLLPGGKRRWGRFPPYRD